MTTRRFAALAVIVCVLLAGVVSWYASRSPDGLEHVAATSGFAQTAQSHPVESGPLAGYQTKGVSNGRLSGGLAGVIGIAVTGAAMGGLVLVLRRRGGSSAVDVPEADVAERG